MYCYGHFYKLSIGEYLLRCRSVLEITKHQPLIPNELLDRQPDAVVVMMNPGSSRPEPSSSRSEGEEEQRIQDPQDIRTRCRLVPARSDNTQKQIIKIIKQMGYNHIRVLNLSDIREPNSGDFFLTIRQGSFMQNNHIQASHSIFSQNRYDELQCRMNPRSRIIIAGWGKSWRKPQWSNIAERCYNMIRGFGFHIIGYQDDDEHDYIFVHPYYPKIKKIWPDCIVSQIRADLRNRNTGVDSRIASPWPRMFRG